MYKTLFSDDRQPPMFPRREESYYSPDIREQQAHSNQQSSTPLLGIDRSAVSFILTQSLTSSSPSQPSF